MICDFCEHPLSMHDPLTGLCLIEDCDCIDYDPPEQSSPFPLTFPERE